MAKFRSFQDLIPTNSDNNGVTDISIEKLVAYKNHPFRLYEGDRLNDMIESIKENGILNPLIVRENKNKYEILAGHNRANAAKQAGLTKVPCIIKQNLSDEDAYIYVIETNLIQRSFNDLLPSEKGKVLKEKYDNMKNQGKRNDIILELKKLNREPADETNEDSRTSIGLQYGMSSSTVARLIRITYLIPELQQLIDDNKLALIPGVDLSYLSEKEQTVVYEIIADQKLTLSAPKAKELRDLSPITKETVLKVFTTPKKESYQRVNVSSRTYTKYFKGKKSKEVEKIIEEALRKYFEEK